MSDEGHSDGTMYTTTTEDGETSTFTIPSWIYNPKAWFVGVLIGWILDIWGAFLGYVDALWSTIQDIPDVAVYQPISTAFGAPGAAIQDAWREVGTIATDVSEVAGPFAPLVVVGIWLVPMLIAVTTLYFLWGIIETYLPVEGIPVIRRFA